MARSDLETLVDLDRIKLSIRGRLVHCGDLVIWDTSSIDDPTCVKGAIAELVAAVGPDLAKKMVVTF